MNNLQNFLNLVCGNTMHGGGQHTKDVIKVSHMKFGALSSDYEDYSLLGCDAMYAGLSLL
jgi:hypothetical protein